MNKLNDHAEKNVVCLSRLLHIYVLTLLNNLNIEANSMEPDRRVPAGAV